jgi:hypothetical protein
VLNIVVRSILLRGKGNMPGEKKELTQIAAVGWQSCPGLHLMQEKD